MENLSKGIEYLLGISPALQNKIAYSLLIILLLWWLHILVIRLVWRLTPEPRLRYRWQKASNYTTFILGVFMVGSLWFRGFQSAATILGLLSAGLAVALKDLIADLAGWIFILWRKPFAVGDRIQIGSSAGDVIDIRPLQFTLMEIGNWVAADQSTGRILHIPNSMVLNQALANYTQGFGYIWNEVPVLLTFESNWQKAKCLLTEVAHQYTEKFSKDAADQINEASKQFMISYQVLTPTVYTSVKDSGVLLTIRYLCEPKRRRCTEETIWEDILKAFSQNPDIDFAYPTQRFYNNVMESKIPAPTANPKGSVSSVI